ncbi:MAG: SMI1/KNR4 family protein [Planctomycetia bacterium]|nr:SMI1/KNR4 family protein [Planctomycetia bacterium]
MSLEQFDAHLLDSAPGFRCFACGDPSEEPRFLARVINVVGKAGSMTAIAAVDTACSADAPALRRFVQRHDGVMLYQDEKSDAAGIEFFKATEWQVRTKEMRESMIAMGFEENDMPEWFHKGVVFGEIPHSGNYFVVQPSGIGAGRVFYCDHDDFQTEPLAESLEDLLSLIVKDPPGFLYQCGCFTRYSDGKTDIQWIPMAYIADCRCG